MLKKNLYTAIRNIVRNRIFSIINILGLSVGFACVILIMIWVRFELSYDRYHKNIDELYRVSLKYVNSDINNLHSTQTSCVIAKTLVEDYPEIIKSCRYTSTWKHWLIQIDDEKIMEYVKLADQSFLDMFSFKCVNGNLREALLKDNSAVITESIAEKYFGNVDPIGKTIVFSKNFPCIVTAVIKDIPNNSHLSFKFLLSLDFFRNYGIEIDNPYRYCVYTYVQLKKNVSYKELNDRIKDIDFIARKKTGHMTHAFLHPVKDIHLYPLDGGGVIQGVKSFSIMALFILIIACMNYINLSTAIANKRFREVGIKRIIGAVKSKIIGQYLIESVIISVFSLFIALLIVEALIPGYNSLFNEVIEYNLLQYKYILFMLVVIAVIIGIVAGIYPALYLSKLNPVNILKSLNSSGKRRIYIRELLVVFQFCISIILIYSAVAVKQQIIFMQNKELGVNTENVFYSGLNGEIKENYALVKQKLLLHDDVTHVSACIGIPPNMNFYVDGISWEGKPDDFAPKIYSNMVDFDYAETMNIEVIEGEFFSKKCYNDSNEVVINKTLADLIGKKPIVGETINMLGKEYKISGVVDYHFLPLQHKKGPLVLSSYVEGALNILVKIKSDDIPKTLVEVEKIFKEVDPVYPTNFHFVDEQYDKLYSMEQRRLKIYSYFSIIAILISCLGLYGLVSFIVEQKTKEIGIRKVNGSLTFIILFQLIKDLLKWIIIAILIALPLANYIMNSWLQDFAFRIKLSWWIYLFAGGLPLFVAILSVSFVVWRAVSRNPVESLRYE